MSYLFCNTLSSLTFVFSLTIASCLPFTCLALEKGDWPEDSPGDHPRAHINQAPIQTPEERAQAVEAVIHYVYDHFTPRGAIETAANPERFNNFQHNLRDPEHKEFRMPWVILNHTFNSDYFFELVCGIRDLKKIYLEDLGITVIPDAIGNLTHLKTLDLQKNDITVIPEALLKLQDLYWLDLGRNAIRGIPLKFAQALKEQNPEMTVFFTRMNQKVDTFFPHGMATRTQLAEIFPKNINLMTD